MKSFTLLILFLCAGVVAFSQNWNPFPKNQASFFKQQKEAVLTVDCFLMDSIQTIGNKQFYLFNAKNDLPEACNTNLRNGLKKYHIIDNPNRIDSLYSSGDSLLFVFHNEFFDYEHNKTFIFKPFSKLNESWISNGITIKCVELGIKSILGESDSIKLFKCSGNGFDQIEFELSKNHGFTKFLPIYKFFMVYPLSNMPDEYLELIGYQINGKSKGYRNPEFSDFFHLHQGDILYYNDIKFSTDKSFLIDTIKYSYISKDSVHYKIKRAVFDTKGLFVKCISDSVTYLRKRENILLSALPNWISMLSSPLHNSLAQNYKYLEIENNDTITKVSFSLGTYYLGYNNCRLGSIRDGNSNRSYSTREGEIYQGQYSWGIFTTTLIGSIINGVKRGITDIPTGIDELENDGLKAYPNPVQDYLTIDYPNHTIEKLEVYDVVGNLLVSTKAKEKIDFSSFARGIYFLKIYETNKAFRQIKIMKQ